MVERLEHAPKPSGERNEDDIETEEIDFREIDIRDKEQRQAMEAEEAKRAGTEQEQVEQAKKAAAEAAKATVSEKREADEEAKTTEKPSNKLAEAAAAGAFAAAPVVGPILMGGRNALDRFNAWFRDTKVFTGLKEALDPFNQFDLEGSEYYKNKINKRREEQGKEKLY